MADVFLSYKRSRSRAAHHVADVLRAHAFTVWVDIEGIEPGEDFMPITRRQIQAARAVVVLWCKESVQSEFVLEEARLAQDRGTIVPVWIEPTELPPGFSRLDTIDLSGWDGDPRSERLDRLILRVRKLIGEERAANQADLHRYAQLWRRFGEPTLMDLAMLGGGPQDPSRPARAAQGKRSKALLKNLRARWEDVRSGSDLNALESLAMRAKETADSDLIEQIDRRLEELLHEKELTAALSAATAGKPPQQRTYRIELLKAPDWPRPEVVIIPAGSFVMGAPEQERGSDDSERPLHTVRFERPFAMGKHPVTFDEIASWKKARGEEADQEIGGAVGQPLSRHPATFVSWFDANEYLNWLNQRLGLSGRTDCYRLPSEAEWEYACRGKSESSHPSSPYYFGPTISDTIANFGTFAPTGGKDFQRTTRVGSHPANEFGLHDLHGNVWEWVQDCWHPNYERAPANGEVWDGGDCSRRVLRGGSWLSVEAAVRSASRFFLTPSDRNNQTGFRLCRSLPRATAGASS